MKYRRKSLSGHIKHTEVVGNTLFTKDSNGLVHIYSFADFDAQFEPAGKTVEQRVDEIKLLMAELSNIECLGPETVRALFDEIGQYGDTLQ